MQWWQVKSFTKLPSTNTTVREAVAGEEPHMTQKIGCQNCGAHESWFLASTLGSRDQPAGQRFTVRQTPYGGWWCEACAGMVAADLHAMQLETHEAIGLHEMAFVLARYGKDI